jgi:uncharacterized protein YbjT (DUF2867 family)
VILVTGATGTNGRELVRALHARGAQVRALTRDAKKAEPLKSLVAEIAVGDLAQPASIEKALAGCERLFVLSAVSQQIAEQEATLAQAAKRAGVRHVVKFSANGADPNSKQTFGRLHGEAEQAIAATGLPLTVLRPTFFQQNLLMGAGSIKREGTFRNNLGSAKAAHVDARDIAAVAAAALTEPIEKHAGKVYELRGPQALSFDEIAAIFTRVLGKPVKYVDLTDEQYEAAMLKGGLPPWLARAIVELAEVARSGSAGELNDIVARVGGKKPTTVEQFLIEHRAAFAEPPR